MLTKLTAAVGLLIATTVVIIASACDSAAHSGDTASKSSGDRSSQTAQAAAAAETPAIYSGSEGLFPPVRSVSDLVRMADVIVVGKATAITDSSRTLDRGITTIDSSVTIAVDRTLKGTPPNVLTVIDVRGHRFGSYVNMFLHVRLMTVGHSYALFLRQRPDATYGNYAGVSEPYRYELANGSAIPDSDEPQGLSIVSEQSLYSNISAALAAQQ